MAITPSTPGQFLSLLVGEVSRIRSARRRIFIQNMLIPPYQSRLKWEYGADELFDAWTFADLGERDVVSQFCLGGFGALGSPWGINGRSATQFGMDSGWYPSLDALIGDWGIAE